MVDDDHTSDPQQILTQYGMRVTDQRCEVLAAMLNEPNDITAQGLHERLRISAPSLGLATVYRTLNALADAGVLDRLHHDATGTCFRYCRPGHHHHLRCRHCHKVVELRDCELSEWTTQIGHDHGFRNITHALELEGVCDACSRA